MVLRATGLRLLGGYIGIAAPWIYTELDSKLGDSIENVIAAIKQLSNK